MTKRYTVAPNAGASHNWEVQSNGRVVSKHRKKSAAKRKARKLADSGDRLVIQGQDGAIITNNEVR